MRKSTVFSPRQTALDVSQEPVAQAELIDDTSAPPATDQRDDLGNPAPFPPVDQPDDKKIPTN
jgi:hypothetical protein